MCSAILQSWPSGNPPAVRLDTSRRVRYNLSMAETEQEITPEQVRHVAMLARLALSEAELSRLTPQLASIVRYIAKLGELDVSGVEPMAHAVPVTNVLREDIVEPSLPLDKVLQNAPDTDGPFFKVPKVIGGDEDSAA